MGNTQRQEEAAKDGVSEHITSQDLLWLCDGDSLGNQKVASPLLEAGTR
jgi:hypothetical protein